MTLRDVAVLLLVPLALLALVDGVGLHLWRLRLFARPDSRREHLLHTARAMLFPGILVLVYARETSGPLLAFAVALVAADTLLEVWDTFEEPRSRASLGGLSRGESLLHVVLVSLRSASLALVFASKPAWVWSSQAGAWSATVEPWQESFVVAGLLPGAIALAVLHVVLGLRWRHGPPTPPAQARENLRQLRSTR